MFRFIFSFVCLAAMNAVTAAVGVGAAPPGSQSAPSIAENPDDERWSLDDGKDVCEAVHFVAITIGIGVGLYWFRLHYVPCERAVRIEFQVDVSPRGELETCRLVEIVAVINNLSRVAGAVTECRFTLAAVEPGSAGAAPGPLEKLNLLAPLFADEWLSARTVLDAGTQNRLVCVASIPREVRQVVVTGHLKHDGRAEPYAASRLIAIG